MPDSDSHKETMFRVSQGKLPSLWWLFPWGTAKRLLTIVVAQSDYIIKLEAKLNPSTPETK